MAGIMEETDGLRNIAACARRKRHPLAKIKGGWTPEEDAELIRLVQELGEGNWSPIARALNAVIGKDESNGRIGKQCRERWNHHLRPDIKKDAWNRDEEALLVKAHQELGNRWSDIAKTIPGRSENAVKNHWNATLRRRDLPDPDPGPLKIYMLGLNLLRPQARSRKANAVSGSRARGGAKGGAKKRSVLREDDTESGCTTEEDEDHSLDVSREDEAHQPMPRSGLESGAVSLHHSTITDVATAHDWDGAAVLRVPQPTPPQVHLPGPQPNDPCVLGKRRRISSATGEGLAGTNTVQTRSPSVSATSTAAGIVHYDAAHYEGFPGGRTWYSASLGGHLPFTSGPTGQPATLPSLRHTPHSSWPPHGSWLPGATMTTLPGMGGQLPTIFPGGTMARTSTTGCDVANAGAGAPGAPQCEPATAALLRDMTMSPTTLALETALALASPRLAGALAGGGIVGGAGGGTVGSFLLDSDEAELIEMLSMGQGMQQGMVQGVGEGVLLGREHLGVGGGADGGLVCGDVAPWQCGDGDAVVWGQDVGDQQVVPRSGSNSSLHTSFNTGPHSPPMPKRAATAPGLRAAAHASDYGSTTDFMQLAALSANLTKPATHDAGIMRLFKDVSGNTVYITTSPLPAIDVLMKRYMTHEGPAPGGATDAAPAGPFVTLRLGSKGPVNVRERDLGLQLAAAGLGGEEMVGCGGSGDMEKVIEDLARMVQHVCARVSSEAGLDQCLVGIRLGSDTQPHEYSVLLAVRGHTGNEAVSNAVARINSGLAPLFR